MSGESNVVGRICDSIHASREEVAEVLGISVERLNNAELSSDVNVLQELDRFDSVVDALSGLIENRAIIGWMKKPNPSLNGRPPRDLLRREDWHKELGDFIESLNWGNFS